jgi:FKBP-type peptidyl-prolyl cis-trans isomerase FklB
MYNLYKNVNMNKLRLLVVFAGLLFLSASCLGPKTGSVTLKNPSDSISYALGYNYALGIKENSFHPSRTPFDSIEFKYMAKAMTKHGLSNDAKENLLNQFGEINEDFFIIAFNNEMYGKKSYFDKESVMIYLQGEFERVRNERVAKELEIAEQNLEKGEKFLEENGKRPEVVTLESGLQYEILIEGAGKIPTEEDMVKVHYHGTLIDGTVFDSSIERDEPASFKTTGVIKGWIEALQLMPVGSKWKLYIPASLAYGQRGSGKVIGPNEILIFEIELLEIEEKNIQKD